MCDSYKPLLILSNSFVAVVGDVACCKLLRKQFKRTFIVVKGFVNIYCLYFIAATCRSKAAQRTAAGLYMCTCVCVCMCICNWWCPVYCSS